MELRTGTLPTHYHCTKKRGNCDQKTINVDRLEEQFEALLERIEIPESFHRWAIEQLKSEHSEEVEQSRLLRRKTVNCMTKLTLNWIDYWI